MSHIWDIYSGHDDVHLIYIQGIHNPDLCLIPFWKFLMQYNNTF